MRMKCEIIQDLIPIYHDGIASDTTQRETRLHLQQCAECRKAYQNYCRSLHIEMRQAALTGDDPLRDTFAALSKRLRRRRILSAASVSSIAAVAVTVVLIGIIREINRYENN